MRLVRGPRENRFRPSIDVLFRSAAYTRGADVIGVVLTGQLDDGTAGLWAITHRGGTAIVQQPSDAAYPSMPQNALRHVHVDHVVTLDELPRILTLVAREPSQSSVRTTGPKAMRTEMEIAAGNSMKLDALRLGQPSSFTCPECHGVLRELRDGDIVRFRCHTGHAYSMQSLLADIDHTIDEQLWSAMRAIQERALLLRRAEVAAREQGDHAEAGRLSRRAGEAEEKAWSIQSLIQDTFALGHSEREEIGARSQLMGNTG
jgi:two-component system chemotaxis response regulator CheB